MEDDFEGLDLDASTLEDMKDMAHVSNEQTKSSPLVMLSKADMDVQPAFSASATSSRSSSRSSKHEGRGKMQVFKDGEDKKEGLQISQATKITRNSMNISNSGTYKPTSVIGIHSRSKSDTTVGPNIQMPFQQEHGTRGTRSRSTCKDLSVDNGKCEAKSSVLSSDRLDLIEQLQRIARDRQDLLDRLHILQIKEKDILSALGDIDTAQPQYPQPSTNNEKTTSILQLEAMVPRPSPSPRKTASRIPVSPLKSSKLGPAPKLPLPVTDTPRHAPRKVSAGRSKRARPVSAPPQTTPTSSRKQTPVTTKRVALADKTQESLAAFDSTPTFTSMEWIVSPIKSPSPSSDSTRGPLSSIRASPPKRATSIQIPMKFDDEPRERPGEGSWERTMDMQGRMEGKVKSWGQSSERRSRPPTPGLTKSYKASHTIKREMWEF